MLEKTRLISILSSEILNLEIHQNFEICSFTSLITKTTVEDLIPDTNYNNLIIKYLDNQEELTLKEFREHIQICGLSSNKKLSTPARSFIWKNKKMCGIK